MRRQVIACDRCQADMSAVDRQRGTLWASLSDHRGEPIAGVPEVNADLCGTCFRAFVPSVKALLATKGEVPLDIAATPWFRLRWETGKVGRWHRARHGEHGSRCPCGVTVAGYHNRDRVILEWAAVLPDGATACRAMR